MADPRKIGGRNGLEGVESIGILRLVLILVLTALIAGVLQGEEHDRLKVYTDVQYLIVIPSGCSSWMLARSSIDAAQFYGFRDDCSSTPFSLGVSNSAISTYFGSVSISRIVETTDCCVKVVQGDYTGWVVRDLLDLTADQRKLYDEHLVVEKAAAAEEAKKDAAEAARRKRLAVERQKKQVEEDARLAKLRAEQNAKAAEERASVRAACSTIYHDTIDKKVKDLTVREEQQVRGCQALDLYPPR